VTLLPAPFGTGLVFRTAQGDVPATWAHATAGEGATVLTCGEARVHTPEHLLAALSALGVTDAILALEGPEVPALDGSAAEWVEAIDEASRVEGLEVEPLRLGAPVTVEAAGGEATIGPGRTLAVEVDFGEGGPAGAMEVALDEASFRGEVAWARTFVLDRDLERMRAAGRGRGATLANTVVWPGSALRSPDEPIRHKLLDAWGDLALLGPAAVGMRVVRGSHALHLAAVRAALSS
jgi:UDP-3-O-[3-hydroxymyristoyl] N-acetylglucosamine deacetylase